MWIRIQGAKPMRINADPDQDTYPSQTLKVIGSVANPYWFNADPDPAFFKTSDPDSVLDLGFWWPKIEKNLKLKIFFLSKLQFTYP